MKGYINQFESFGSVDGPGTRFVIFLQGCPLRCLYCHNPETLMLQASPEYTVDQIIDKIRKLKHYYLNGGVTISGGEPLIQIDFVVELCKRIKEELQLHVAIDTSGITYNSHTKDKHLELCKYVDLFLVDIKHIDNEACLKLTQQSNTNTLNFIEFLNETNNDIWIRYVLVPGLNDQQETLKKTGDFILRYNNISNVEILPYHNLGVLKYENLNMEYKLKDVKSAKQADVDRAYKLMFVDL